LKQGISHDKRREHPAHFLLREPESRHHLTRRDRNVDPIHIGDDTGAEQQEKNQPMDGKRPSGIDHAMLTVDGETNGGGL
jgi:hypothetical protein